MNDAHSKPDSIRPETLALQTNTERKPPSLDGRRSTDFTSRKIPARKSCARVANRYGDRLLLLSGWRVITEITALVSGPGNIGTSHGNRYHFAIHSPFFLFSKRRREREIEQTIGICNKRKKIIINNSYVPHRISSYLSHFKLNSTIHKSWK